MSELQKQFEAWYIKHPTCTSLVRNNSGYHSIGAELAWAAFQAGYAAYQKQLQAEREAYQQHCDNRILGNRIQ